MSLGVRSFRTLFDVIPGSDNGSFISFIKEKNVVIRKERSNWGMEEGCSAERKKNRLSGNRKDEMARKVREIRKGRCNG